jgi:hypothetical protein
MVSSAERKMMQDTKNQEYRISRLLIGFFLVQAVASRFFILATERAFVDDAFITLRYARNLLMYGSFCFNPGEIVYGVSTPLFTVILSVLSLVLPAAVLPSSMQALSLGFFFAATLLILIRYPFVIHAKVVFALVFLSYPRLFYSSLGGMEETLIVLLMVWSAVEIREKRFLVAGAALGLLVVTKIDSGVWIIAALIAAWVWTGRFPVRLTVGAALVSAPWLLYSWAQFGTVIPHTVEAKRVAFPLDHVTAAWDILKLSTPEGLSTSPVAVIFFGCIPYVVVVAALVILVRKKDWWFAVFPLYCLGYVSILVLSGTWSGLWARWIVPMWASLFLCMTYLVDIMFASEALRAAVRITIPRAAGVILISVGLSLLPILYQHHKQMDMRNFELAGEWLRGHSAPASSVMLEPIGLLGYASNMYIYDFVGLVSPIVTRARKESGLHDTWYQSFLRKTRPEFIVLRKEEIDTNRFLFGGYGEMIFDWPSRQWFDSTYVAAGEWNSEISANHLVVFQRRLRP